MEIAGKTDNNLFGRETTMKFNSFKIELFAMIVCFLVVVLLISK